MSSKRRPRLVTCLSLAVLTFSVVNAIGLKAGLSLPDLSLSVPRGYLLFKTGAWALIGLITAAALFIGRPRTLRWAKTAIFLIAVWYWIDRILWMRSDFTRRSWPVATVSTLVIVIVFMWITSRKSVRAYYLENSV